MPLAARTVQDLSLVRKNTDQELPSCFVDANLFVLAFTSGDEACECSRGHVCEVSRYAPDIMLNHITCPRFKWEDARIERELGRGMVVVLLGFVGVLCCWLFTIHTGAFGIVYRGSVAEEQLVIKRMKSFDDALSDNHGDARVEIHRHSPSCTCLLRNQIKIAAYEDMYQEVTILR